METTDEQRQEQFELQDCAFREQLTRFYNETKKRGKKYMEGLRPLITDGMIKVKDMTQEQLLNCLNEAIGKYDLKQADKSATLNRKRIKL